MKQPNQLKKLNHAARAEILQECDLSDALLQSLNTCNDVETINTLIDASQCEAAVKYIALSLPKRESIWWGYITAQDAEGNSDDLVTQNTLKTIKAWVYTPSESLRLNAHKLATMLTLHSLTSWTAMAIYWSDGSIAPEGKPAVLPAPYMAGHAVSNTITMAALRNESTSENFNRYLHQGMHIAAGGNGLVTL